MSEHTKGRWAISETCKDEIGVVCKDNTQGYGMIIPHCSTFGDKAAANARRIAACVNACSKSSTTFLEEASPHSVKTMLDALAELERAQSQRDELLEALKKMVDCPELRYAYTHTHVISAKATIDKYESK